MLALDAVTKQQGQADQPEPVRVVARRPRLTPDGFEVFLIKDTAGYILRAGGLEAHVSDQSDATALFAAATRPMSRLRVDYAGARAFRWSLEIPTETGAYRCVMSSGHGGWFKALRHCTVKYFQN